MKYCALAILALLALPSLVVGQSNGRVSLLVANCKADEGICQTQELVRYDFDHGDYVSKEVILSSTEVRYDLSQSFVLKNRYVITDSGDVIDIQSKTLLHKGIGELVAIRDNQIFSKVDRTDVSGLFLFDLSSNRYSRVKAPHILEVAGTLSPDKSKLAHFQLVRRGRNPLETAIVVEQLGMKRALKAKLGAECSFKCSSGFAVPFIWVDDSRILSQTANGEFILLGLNGKVEPLFKIAAREAEAPDSYPFFYRTEGGIHYSWGSKTYWLNLKDKTFAEDREKLGNGFEIKFGDVFWMTVYFEGKEIGKLWGSSPNSTRDFVAFDYADVGVNLGSPKGIKVWNRTRNDWTTIDVGWGPRIIGWITS